jgi:O-antigen ligase
MLDLFIRVLETKSGEASVGLDSIIILLPAAMFFVLFVRDSPAFAILTFLVSARVFVDGRFNFVMGGYPASGLLGIALIGMAAGMLLRGGRGVIMGAAFAGAIFLSNSFAVKAVGESVADEAIRLSSVLAVFLIVINLKVIPTAHQVARAVQFIGVFSAVFSVYQFAAGDGLLVDGDLRVAGFMTHPNSAALLYSICAIVSIGTFYRAGRSKLDVVLFVVFAVAILATASIGGLLAFLVMLTSYAFLTPGVSSRIRIGLVFIALLGVVAFAASPVGAERLSSFAGLDLSRSGGESNSLEWRIGRWADILQYWRDNPFFGLGYGASTSGQLLRGGYAPHSEYVRMLVETGIVGAVSLLILTIIVLTHLGRRSKIENQFSGIASIALASLIGLLINAVAENTFTYSAPSYVLAILVAYTYSDKRVQVPERGSAQVRIDQVHSVGARKTEVGFRAGAATRYSNWGSH